VKRKQLLSRSGTVTEPESPRLQQKALCLLKNVYLKTALLQYLQTGTLAGIDWSSLATELLLPQEIIGKPPRCW
jgi:hypothetical protein